MRALALAGLRRAGMLVAGTAVINLAGCRADVATRTLDTSPPPPDLSTAAPSAVLVTITGERHAAMAAESMHNRA